MVINYNLNGKATIILLNVESIKKILLHKINYFSEPYNHNKNKLEVELGFSNYATKSDLKNPTGVDTSEFFKRIDLAHLKSGVDKLDIDKLKNVPGGLSSLKSKVDKLDIGKLETIPVDSWFK